VLWLSSLSANKEVVVVAAAVAVVVVRHPPPHLGEEGFGIGVGP